MFEKNDDRCIVKRIVSPFVLCIKFIQNYFKTFVLLSLVILALVYSDKKEEANLAEVHIEGPIFNISKILERLDEVYENDNIKGVLLIVDSGGGGVAPSTELSYYIKKIKEKKPVIVYAAGTIASGSYYASIYSNKIIANPGSLVGSIGVIFESFDIKELINTLGIKEQVVQAGKYKQSTTFLRQWKPYERKELEKVILDTYDIFLNDVAKARGLDVKNKEVFADARIFTARQAKKVGLIDEIGIKIDAIAELKKLTKIKRAVWLDYSGDIKDEIREIINSISIEIFSDNFKSGLKAI